MVQNVELCEFLLFLIKWETNKWAHLFKIVARNIFHAMVNWLLAVSSHSNILKIQIPNYQIKHGISYLNSLLHLMVGASNFEPLWFLYIWKFNHVRLHSWCHHATTYILILSSFFLFDWDVSGLSLLLEPCALGTIRLLYIAKCWLVTFLN